MWHFLNKQKHASTGPSMASKVELMYGKGHVEVEIDEGVEVVVVEKPPMPLLTDPTAAVQAAIEVLTSGNLVGRSDEVNRNVHYLMTNEHSPFYMGQIGLVH